MDKGLHGRCQVRTSGVRPASCGPDPDLAAENESGARDLRRQVTGAGTFGALGGADYSLGWSPESPVPESGESPATPAGGSGAVSGTGATTVISTSSESPLRSITIVEPGSS